MIQFSRQMYSLLRAGVPILSALSGLASNTRNRTLAKTLTGVIENLQAGWDLSSSLAQYPKVFSVFYVSLVRVGETSGRLEEVFRQLSGYLEREQKTRKQIKSAMRYPVFVLVAILIAVIVINVFVVPAFAAIFEQFGADLPLPTRILIATSDAMINHWQAMLGVVILMTTGLGLYVRKDSGRYKWHKTQLRLPLVGKVLYQATLARFSRQKTQEAALSAIAIAECDFTAAQQS